MTEYPPHSSDNSAITSRVHSRFTELLPVDQAWVKQILTQRHTLESRHRHSPKHLYPNDDAVFFTALKKLVHDGPHSARDVDREFGFAKGGFNLILHGSRGLALDRLPLILEFLGVTPSGKGMRADLLTQMDRLIDVSPEKRSADEQWNAQWNRLRFVLEDILTAHKLGRRVLVARLGSEALYNFALGRQETVKPEMLEKLAQHLGEDSAQSMINKQLPPDSPLDITFVVQAFRNTAPHHAAWRR